MLDTRKGHILIVDDNPNNLKLAGHIICDQGYDVKFAESGNQALQLTETQNFDVILLDIMMPEMDGFSVLEKLLESEKTKDIPVIFLTAFDDAGVIVKAFKAGATDYVTKPFQSLELLARIETQLKLKHQQLELQRMNQQLQETLHIKEEFDCLMKHDLKTPLNGIIPLARMLRETDELTDEQTEWVKTIETSSWNLLEMINRSMDLYKLEKGTYKLQAKPCDLLQLTQTVVNNLKARYGFKDLVYEISLNQLNLEPQDCLICQGDEMLLYSMLFNLITNAAEASPLKGKINLAFEDKDSIHILIDNQGTVPEQMRKTFFEKYSTHGKQSGMGIGAYSAKLIAKIHKGGIELDTNQEDYTRILIELPKNFAASPPAKAIPATP